MSARGGTRIPLWSPGFRYRPDVEPPGLLRLVAALCIVSIVGALVYAVGVTISANGTAMPEPVAAAYVALLHFVLPFGITFAVQTNHWISRPLLLCYALLLCGATAAGHGWLGQLLPSAPARITGAMAALLMLLAWLFGSKRMRIYYARLSGSRLSPELRAFAARDDRSTRRGEALRAFSRRLLEHLETLVMLGFIALVLGIVYSFGD